MNFTSLESMSSIGTMLLAFYSHIFTSTAKSFCSFSIDIFFSLKHKQLMCALFWLWKWMLTVGVAFNGISILTFTPFVQPQCAQCELWNPIFAKLKFAIGTRIRPNRFDSTESIQKQWRTKPSCYCNDNVNNNGGKNKKSTFLLFRHSFSVCWRQLFDES